MSPINLADVMDDLGAALAAIPGLRTFPYYVDKVTPPAAVVAWPDVYDFDQTMQRGSDRVVIPVTVVVGKANVRAARDAMAKYVAGSGAQSVKEVVEAHAADSYDSARVQSVEFGTVTIASTAYLAATFDIEITAPGE